MQFQPTISPLYFRHWLYKDSENHRLLWFSGGTILLLFVWFKIDCPYPNFIPDSYSYLQAAYNNDFIHIRPIGYSKFLRLFSSFNRSHWGLVFTQYLLVQAAVLYFLTTVRYLFNPGKWLFRFLLAVSILNPVWLRLANFITSDALFAALSFAWFTQLLWMQYRPTMRLLFIHAFIILLAFSVRYNALWYPMISTIGILLAPVRPTGKKFIPIGLIAVLLTTFILRTRHEYHQQTHTSQFSGFGGWQLAINALYAYAHSPQTPVDEVPTSFQHLHILVNQHNDSLRGLRERPDKTLGIYYLSDSHSPLNVYLYKDHSRPEVRGDTRRWLMEGALYGPYGSWLAQKHPAAYSRYFLLPNLYNYCLPSPEFMGRYSIGSTQLDAIAIQWFLLHDATAYTYRRDWRIQLIQYLPVLFALANLVFPAAFIGFGLLGGFRRASPYRKKILWLSLLVWAANGIFSVTASVVVLRYQVFPMLLLYSFGALLTAYCWQQSQASPNNQTTAHAVPEQPARPSF